MPGDVERNRYIEDVVKPAIEKELPELKKAVERLTKRYQAIEEIEKLCMNWEKRLAIASEKGRSKLKKVKK